MDTCRLCLYSGGEVQIIPIFNSQYGNLCGKIEECVSLKIKEDDTLTLICVNCVQHLKQWEDFKERCFASNEILLKKNAANNEKGNIGEVEIKAEIYLSDDEKRKITKTEIEEESFSLSESTELKRDVVNDEDSDFDEPLETNAACNEDEEGYLEDIFDDDEVTVNANNCYTCEICPKIFHDCLEYLDHQETHDGELVFKCSKCTEVFTSRTSLVQHENNHKTPCSYCGKLILKSSMKLHLNMHSDKYKCSDCYKRFNCRAALNQHIITVHTEVKDHVCEHCGKTFATAASMRVHTKTHSDVRNYPCKQCSYAGRTASALYIHMATHSKDVCLCELCSKSFKSMRNLNDHLRRFHSKVKKYACNECGKKFVEKYLLMLHVRGHTGVRPYKCEKCDKSFVRSDGLREHVKTHKKVALECMECGKSFTSTRGFSRHVCLGVL